VTTGGRTNSRPQDMRPGWLMCLRAMGQPGCCECRANSRGNCRRRTAPVPFADGRYLGCSHGIHNCPVQTAQGMGSHRRDAGPGPVKASRTHANAWITHRLLNGPGNRTWAGRSRIGNNMRNFLISSVKNSGAICEKIFKTSYFWRYCTGKYWC